MVHELSKTSAGFLFSQSPVKPTATIPHFIPKVPKPKPIPESLLRLVPANILEEELQNVLEEYVKREAVLFSALTSIQACCVLQSLYCERLRSQLNAKVKKATDKKGSGKLVGDGLPRLLMADDFVERVRAFVERQLAEADEKERMRTKKDAYAVALQQWNEAEEVRKARNEERRAEWKEEVGRWQVENALAKQDHRRPRWIKPVLGKLPKAAPKPKAPRRRDIVQNDDEGEFFDIENIGNESMSSTSSTDDIDDH
ncbi:hypothetical protein SCHPADRAFT_829156 [Schizopora paradoxa]|uniref:Uncharacterized protein n=1 Tax=Schizopora paradoxa TaxID=27342 RepID=A0A0H2RL48_9AGAM|nr:hypothetical protein SCHPADRAFT_829156 [Schizopora paradoxa]